MYNVAPGATAAWRRVLDWVGGFEIIDHAHPATLADLWGRDDLGCAFMCGWPLAQEGGARPVIAAPVPVGEHGARYRSVFVVAADSRFRRLEDTFGTRFAFNAKGSHSGWNMPQAHLRERGGWYAEEIGPFGPHQRAAAAVASGQADVAALDSLVWALLCRHDPGLAGRLRVIDRTADQPSPPLVGSPALDETTRRRARSAFLSLPAPLLAEICVSGFSPATLQEYDETLRIGPTDLHRHCEGRSDAAVQTYKLDPS